MAGATRFHLVRHASYGLAGHVLAGRTPGLSLHEQGRQEATLVAQALVRRPVAAILSSPQPRAQETAAPIARALGLDVVPDPDLDEIDFGEWTGRSFDALAPLRAWQAFNRLRSLARVPGGETMLAAQARAVRTVQRVRVTWPQAEVVLVSHADVLKAILAHALGLPLDLMQRIELAPASRSVVVLFDEDVRVEAVNLPPGA